MPGKTKLRSGLGNTFCLRRGWRYLGLPLAAVVLSSAIPEESQALCPVELGLAVNGGFESPPIAPFRWRGVPQASVPGWSTTATGNNARIEIWRSGVVVGGVFSTEGGQLAELNYTGPAQYYQDVSTGALGGRFTVWSFDYRNRPRVANQSVRMLIGPPGAQVQQGDFPGTNAWLTRNGIYQIPPGQATTRAGIRTLSPSGGAGNLLDDFHLDLLAACDSGDAPAGFGEAIHLTPSNRLKLGVNAPDIEAGDQASVAADGDDAAGIDDEDGVNFSTVGDGDPTKFPLTARVTGTNNTGTAAMLCGWLDGAANGTTNGTFDRAVTYAAGQVGLASPSVGSGNEELCIRVPTSGATSLILGGGSNPASASCTGGTAFSCTLTWNPNYTANLTTYARFRLTTDDSFFSAASPSPVGILSNGELEDYRLIIQPTQVTIGEVELQSARVTDFLGELGVDGMDRDELLQLLQVWDPGLAAALADAESAQILSALMAFLDPDVDGQVAVLRWDTLEERGTIGFYVERQEEAEGWTRLNGGMLPGFIDAPLGGEYRLADPQARSGIDYRYRLIEQEARGTKRTYGPYELRLE